TTQKAAVTGDFFLNSAIDAYTGISRFLPSRTSPASLPACPESITPTILKRSVPRIRPCAVFALMVSSLPPVITIALLFIDELNRKIRLIRCFAKGSAFFDFLLLNPILNQSEGVPHFTLAYFLSIFIKEN